jgi:hypothetical protein
VNRYTTIINPMINKVIKLPAGEAKIKAVKIYRENFEAN